MSNTPSQPQVTLFTDGACRGNPGPGGYGVVLVAGDRRKELSGGFAATTNNRMEMMAAIVGLESLLGPTEVRLVSDSKYVVDAFEKGWLRKWQRNGWQTASRKPVLNRDLWERLLALCETHAVRFEWVRGHSGHPENERCDELAVAASRESQLPPDPGFSTGGAAQSDLF